MRYALIRNGKVINTIILEDPGGYHAEGLLIQTDTASIGDSWDGGNFTKAVEPSPSLDWGAYNRSLLINAAYNRVSQTSTNRASVRRLETVAIAAGVSGADYQNIDIIVMLWNDMIDGVPLLSKPIAQEIGEWRAIAAAAFMPFDFDADGKMVLS
ncbi:MAG: hypothetical protein KME52_11760 [Desmonostoc geniculatum HA4340-LM1]|jgi:hypothetical protein|nr:hypothetical protein [Desmonostoc geniculatum HA4340-LM1]